jgi:hypothetical protein
MEELAERGGYSSIGGVPLVEAGESKRNLVTPGCVVKTSFKLRSATFATRLAISLFVIAAASQAPRSPEGRRSGLSARSPRTFQAPTNLKVLPKNLTGQQVHDVMERWSSELGVRCSACHVRESEGILPDGPAYQRFADDSKPMKSAARIMYAMTEEINGNLITRVSGATSQVTCGICHRGNIRPEPFILPPPDKQGSTIQVGAPAGAASLP